MNKNESKYFNTAILFDEALIYLLENKDMVVKSVSNIEQNFQEEEIQEMLEEADYWDGDETDKINY